MKTFVMMTLVAFSLVSVSYAAETASATNGNVMIQKGKKEGAEQAAPEGQTNAEGTPSGGGTQ